MIPFRNELALVTGGAVRLGREIALGLAQDGYGIALHYRSSGEAADQTAREIEAFNVPCTLIQADLSDPTQIESIFETVGRQQYPLSVLVNSAAIMPRGNLTELTVAEWDDTLDLNLTGSLVMRQSSGKVDASSRRGYH